MKIISYTTQLELEKKRIEKEKEKQKAQEEKAITQKLDQMKYEENWLVLSLLSQTKDQQEIQKHLELTCKHYTYQIINDLSLSRLFESIAIQLTKLSCHQLLSFKTDPLKLDQWIAALLKLPALPTLFDEQLKSLKKVVAVQALQPDSILENVSLPLVTQGPIKKNRATTILEVLYSESLLGRSTFRVNLRDEVLVTICNYYEFNLTYLMLEADLTQFNFDKKKTRNTGFISRQ